MLSRSSTPAVNVSYIRALSAASALHARLAATEFNYRKGVEIYGEKEPEHDVLVANNLLGLTTNNLRHAEDHMLLLGRKTALERVAAFLLEMDSRLKPTNTLALPMCRRDIADYLGLTLET